MRGRGRQVAVGCWGWALLTSAADRARRCIPAGFGSCPSRKRWETRVRLFDFSQMRGRMCKPDHKRWEAPPSVDWRRRIPFLHLKTRAKPRSMVMSNLHAMGLGKESSGMRTSIHCRRVCGFGMCLHLAVCQLRHPRTHAVKKDFVPRCCYAMSARDLVRSLSSAYASAWQSTMSGCIVAMASHICGAMQRIALQDVRYWPRSIDEIGQFLIK